jgi:hypothetical protein
MHFFVEFSNQEQHPILTCVEDSANQCEQVLRNTYVHFESQQELPIALNLRFLPAVRVPVVDKDFAL